MQPVHANTPTNIHIETPRQARIQRQHRWALSPTRRRRIHFTPEANPNLRPKRTQIYARSEPKFTPEANPCPIKTFACEKNVPNTNMTPVTNHLQLAASLGSLTLLNFPAAKISWTACLGYESPTEIDHRFLWKKCFISRFWRSQKLFG